MPIKQQPSNNYDLPPLPIHSATAVVTKLDGTPVVTSVIPNHDGETQHHGTTFKRGFLVDTTHPKKKKAASIPDCLRLRPSPEDASAAHKQQLLHALAPDASTVQEVLTNPTLLAGFEDPQVMAAVAEIATNPSAAQMHARNPAVAAFYSNMAEVMQRKLERTGALPIARHADAL